MEIIFVVFVKANAIREMELFLDAVYPERPEINESAYLEICFVTAYSLFSRNRNLGKFNWQRLYCKICRTSMSMVAEGYYATSGIYEIAYEKTENTYY